MEKSIRKAASHAEENISYVMGIKKKIAGILFMGRVPAIFIF